MRTAQATQAPRGRAETAPGDFAALLGRSLEAGSAPPGDAGATPTPGPVAADAAPEPGATAAEGSTGAAAAAPLLPRGAAPRTVPPGAAADPAATPITTVDAAPGGQAATALQAAGDGDPGDARRGTDARTDTARSAATGFVPGAALAAGGRAAVADAAPPEATATAPASPSASAAPAEPRAGAEGLAVAAARSAAGSAPPVDPAALAAALASASAASISASGASAAAAAPPQALLPHPPGTPAFAAALGQQVGLWLRQGVPQALLQLNPAELGPVAVRITLDGTQAQVDFTALHAATRSALEASLPALAGALREGGLTLAGGGVFDRPREQRDAPAPTTPAAPAEARADHGAAAPADAPPPPRRRGVVDLVA
jgi:hypothetical protein